MRSASPALISHLGGTVVTLASCWRISRRDGLVVTLTDHDADLVISGETYAAGISYERTAISAGSDLSVDNMEVRAILDSTTFTEREIRGGLWDGAAIRIFLVNWADLTQGVLKRTRGKLGQVSIREDGAINAELLSMASPLQKTVGRLWQAECNLDLGEAKCGIDLALGAGWTLAATIESLPSSAAFVVQATGPEAKPDAYFTGGVAVFMSGTNDGVAREILDWNQATRTVTLLEPPPYAPAIGDTLRLQPGCDGRWETCRDTFNNRLNHRGCRTLPGQRAITETPVAT